MDVRTATVMATSIVCAAEAVHALILGSIVGVVVDRWDPRRIFVNANLLHALVAVPLMILAVSSNGDWRWIADVGTIVQQSRTTISNAAKHDVRPTLVSAEHLVAATASPPDVITGQPSRAARMDAREGCRSSPRHCGLVHHHSAHADPAAPPRRRAAVHTLFRAPTPM
jgi:hypothetical protein